MNVLDRKTNIKGNYLLEASAGTGKTFAIQHLVVRMLLEEDFNFDEILVVTFTRASTRELKSRIKAMLEENLDLLNNPTKEAPDYLLAIIEEGEERIKKAKRKLGDALLEYHNVAIFTIHAFCLRMLQEYAFEGDFCVGKGEETRELFSVIKDFFRTETKKYGVEQLKIALSKNLNDIDKLAKAISQVIERGYDIVAPKRFEELQEELRAAMSQLSKPDIEDFIALVEIYKGVMTREKTIKPAILEYAQDFVTFFDEQDLDKIIEVAPCLELLQDENLKKNKERPLFSKFIEAAGALLPIIAEAKSYANIFCCMAYDCQQMVQKFLREEEALTPDQILRLTAENIQNKIFVDKIRKRFKVALVDEFQDTDPLQWQIFDTIFLKGNRRLYLVGDPKQSIYSFRNADIYTYIQASKNMKQVSLDTNYRSEPKLVEGLNYLFSKAEDFIELPRLNTTLPYEKVNSSEVPQEVDFNDKTGRVHLAVVTDKLNSQQAFNDIENKYFFPFITQEIMRIKRPYNAQAILVRDRYQAERMKAFLEKYNIPTIMRRTQKLNTQPIKELIEAIIDFKKINTALGGPIFAYTHNEIQKMDPEKALDKFYNLKKIFMEKGFAFFWQTVVDENITNLLSGKVPFELYHELQQIAENLMLEESTTPAQLLKRITDLDNEEIPTTSPRDNGINIITLHISKGLQFDVVYALGLINRTSMETPLKPVSKGGKTFLSSQANLEYIKEVNAEKMRQLYVAMTRAKHRLYLPVAIDTGGKVLDSGSLSPMELFVNKCGGIESFVGAGDGGIRGGDKGSGNAVSVITSCDLKDIEFDLVRGGRETKVVLAPQEVKVCRDKLFLNSFSSLATSIYQGYGEVPHDFESDEKNAQTLPGGVETGILLHELCEHKKDSEYLEKRIKGTPYESWGEVLSGIVEKAYGLKLCEGFCLNDVNPEYVRHEEEFIFKDEKGYYKGYIDLFFMYGDKYYLLDWKSNWAEEYAEENIEKAMQEHDYYLQAKIYTEALKRYLNVVEKRPFEECFGGIFYLFLRGTVVKKISCFKPLYNKQKT
jgi:exodeoxyribonuclease V beta subunit